MAVVDATLVLGSLDHESVCVGQWLNVVGYVEPRDKALDDGDNMAIVQAVTVWKAGQLDLGEYERSFVNGHVAT